MAFFLTAAGPFGYEDGIGVLFAGRLSRLSHDLHYCCTAVRAAGPLLTLVATIVMPLLWALPVVRERRALGAKPNPDSFLLLCLRLCLYECADVAVCTRRGSSLQS